MNRSIVFRIIMALVLIGALVGIGIYAYNAGIAQGLAQNVQVEAGKAPTTIPLYGYPYGPHFGWFGGFGFLGCLVPLFFIFLAFAALRGLFWFGPRRWHMHHHGPWGMHSEGEDESHAGVPPMFEEWHRRSHEKSAPDNAGK